MTALKVNKRNSIGKRHSKKFIHKLNNEDDIKLFLQNLFLRKKNYNQWTYQLHGKFGLMDNFHNICIPKNIYIYIKTGIHTWESAFYIRCKWRFAHYQFVLKVRNFIVDKLYVYEF